VIIFKGTKRVLDQSFMIFMNEEGYSIQVPVDEKTQSIFLHHFDRLAPGTKLVEKSSETSSS
jgi:hypothetical protein